MHTVDVYHIDLTLTNQCNFSCDYCYQDHESKTFNKINLFINKCNELLNSSFFNDNYNILNICFWGGEPLLNFEVLKVIIEYYSNNDKVKFYIFTNGSLLDNIYYLLDKYKNKRIGKYPKIYTQISYDGIPIHDIYRKTNDGKLTSNNIRSKIELLHNNKIPYVIKSTCPPESLKYLYDAYKDINEFSIKSREDKLNNVNFSLSIDHFNLDSFITNKYISIFEDFESSMSKISIDEIKFYKKYNDFSFKWFKDIKSTCSAGMGMITIDTDCDIYKCHAVSKENKINKQHYITSLKNDNFIKDISFIRSRHKSKCSIPDKCNKCKVNFCAKCNIAKYNKSTKDNYFERWNDFSCQETLCKFFEINWKYKQSVNEILSGY